MTAGIIALLFGVVGFILNTSSSRVRGIESCGGS